MSSALPCGVATLEPVRTDVVATGNARLVDQAIWYEITADGRRGWANIAFLAFEGVVDDVTSQVVDSLGERPVAETMLDLGRIVAEDVVRFVTFLQSQ